MNHKRNWIVGIALSATATFVAIQTVNAPSVEVIPTVTLTLIHSTETPTLAYEGCAYTWAYQDAPELTEKLDKAVKELNLEASATATLFGEDCIYADGSSAFGAMETDFKVQLPVDDLTSYEEFGNWIKEVMQLVTEIPREELAGPMYGFVEFWFEKDELEHIVFRVSIQAYLNEASDKTGVELFNMYYMP